jgi:MFS transporter, NNP family, nitrate/nitrite transporter
MLLFVVFVFLLVGYRKQYSSYHVQVDAEQDDRAKEILICDFRRPHMRAFHCSWWSFFICFFIWFGVNPLLPYITDDLQLTKNELWTSNIVSVGGTIFVRIALGPLADRIGSRVLFSLLLCLVSIPCACTGFVQTARGFTVLRLFIGFAGGSFVLCQDWTTTMFAKEVVGTANGLTAGWGNLGAGVTQLVINSMLLPLFISIYRGNTEKAWRTILIVPAFVGFITGIILPQISDDCPKGNYKDLVTHGSMQPKSMTKSIVTAAINWNTWILFLQYAACFGVEITMNAATALYFRDEFGQSSASAAAIASIFGWLDLFARGLGGFYSDKMNARYGMRGRIIAQASLLLAEGIMVLIFARTNSFGGAIFALIVFSFFVQSAAGTSFGIVPYINPHLNGSVIGIVGAGGNVGAVVFGNGFRTLTYDQAFDIMGYFAIASAFLSFFIVIEGQSRFLFRQDLVYQDRKTDP